MGLFTRELTLDAIERIALSAEKLADEGDWDGAWDASKPLRKALPEQRAAARTLAHLMKSGVFEPERGLEVAQHLLDARGEEPWAVAAIGAAAQSLHDIRYLNDAPPSDEIFRWVANQLRAMLPTLDDPADIIDCLDGLSTVAGVLGRRWDDTAERAYRRLVELRPERWQDRYNLGLFYKRRGRFSEGLAANQEALRLLAGEEDDGVIWNLGICATGAGDAAAALAIWKKMGQKIEMGRFGLPEGGYSQVKVRLAQFPVATRTPEEDADGPGLEETIWVERLSPCHGVIRSALVQDLGIDYGDVILFDGAPITYHTYDGESVAVFPHLATLSHQRYAIFEFAGTQAKEGQIGELSAQLSQDAIVYVHTEQFQILCRECWENPGLDHAHEDEPDDHRVVTGKICAPPTMTPDTLRGELDTALAKTAADVSLLVPELSRAVGDDARADVEQRRMSMILDS